MMSGTGSGIPDFPIVVLTFFVGLTVFAVVYISKLLKAPAAEDSTKRKETEVTKKEKPAANVTQKPSKKKHQEKWTRDSKQTFSHPWLLTSLKGHSGTVLDMDFSSNGKYLATCAEDSEELDPGGEGSEQGSGNSSGSEANKENSPQGQTDGNQKGALLTRRQKKNRTRRNDGSPLPRNNIAAKKSKAKARRSGGVDSSGKRNGAPTLRQHAKLNLSDSDLSVLLRHYLLSPDQLLGLGYPVESALYPGRAIIYKNPPSSSNPNSSNVSSCMQSPDPLRSSSHLFDVNAREFVPMSARLGKEPCCLKEDNVHVKNENLKNTVLITDFVKKDQPGMDYSEIGAEWDASHSTKSEKNSLSTGSDGDSADSGINRSGGEEGSSSASQEASDVDGVIEEDQGIVPEIKQSTVNSSERKHLSKVAKAEKLCVSEEKKCVRCGRGFFVTEDGEYLTQEHCLYHWGKLQRVVSAPSKASSMSLRMEYSCCHGKPSSKGCTTAKLHVWNGVGVGINGPFDSYVRTRPRRTHPPDGNYGVYALDCEMCYTTRGLELTKVTVVAPDGRLVYDCLVRPENYIIDYNTRFSGITARDLNRRGATKSLKDVQNDLMGFINADTILVGHGLENDLRALRIIHSTVIDTSVVFPHYYGLPYRRSLKSLVGCLLKRDIQQDSSGHDSFEDARASIELMLWKVRKDFRAVLEK
ncbi:uncharacterized protein LOC126418949 isoform X2 [Schistocerca serialis cubense]|uniref:uncharacterized protein LOC126418949 isoform X2 n=1 Tax=Schistocerca serialis cubense TaxID=2023355 RepID=UPI00214F15EB|nr:uncharacterized protein LOC126418949 isoform X2 [Schistocerca serialis cubense]